MKIPVFNFPWNCWKCHKPMNVTYPFSSSVLNSQFRGNLAETYSKTLESEVIGNLCPSCGAYQGNYFVFDDCLIEHAYDLELFIGGYFDVTVNCITCGKELEDNQNEELFPKLDDYYEFLALDKLDFEKKKEIFADRIHDLSFRWFCKDCFEIESLKRKEITYQRKLQSIREGPLKTCCICKKNTKEDPETDFEEHHVSYFPEEKVMTCKNCHVLIHTTNDYPKLKPKNKRLSQKEIHRLERFKILKEKKENGTLEGDWCPYCAKEILSRHSYTFYNGEKIHLRCLKKIQKKSN